MAKAAPQTPSRTQLAAIGAQLNAVAVDLSSVRAILGILVNESPDVALTANLACGAEAITVRAGRAIEQCAMAFGETAFADWHDYDVHGVAEKVAHE